ncbi:MAG: preprotein translocase subunit SecY [Fusobacteriaceae bacterium]
MALIDIGLNKLKNIAKVPELKTRITFTLLMFLVARIGTHIPVPGVDIDRLAQMTEQNDILSYINMFSGGGFSRVSIFALGIVPYINASIAFSLLGSIIPKLDEMRKEGEASRNRITQWTRYLTIIIAMFQSGVTCVWLQSTGLVVSPGIMFFITTIVILTAGTVFLMWVGEQISIKGIGNGVSLLIFLNIISRMPANVAQTIQTMRGSKFLIPILIAVSLAAVLVIAGIIAFQLGQRKIPVHYVGRGFGGKAGMEQNSYIPLKLNTAGIMPVIFASVIMIIPSVLINALPSTMTFKVTLARAFANSSPIYLALYALVIVFFSFFYTSIVFDPDKVADNLKQGGGTIPGIRPGEETANYLEKVVTRITWGGSLFLVLISILPMIIFTGMGLPVYFGGTGILIVVGVALDTIQQVDAHMVVKEYKGFI